MDGCVILRRPRDRVTKLDEWSGKRESRQSASSTLGAIFARKPVWFGVHLGQLVNGQSAALTFHYEIEIEMDNT